MADFADDLSRVLKYATDHDHVLKVANDALVTGERTPLRIFADLLDEQGRPGGRLARAGADAMDEGVDLGLGDFVSGEGKGFRESVSVGNNVRIHPHSHRRSWGGLQGEFPVSLRVFHSPDDWLSDLKGQNTLTYGIPVRSRRHLDSLINDLPSEAQADLHQRLDHHLPETHPNDADRPPAVGPDQVDHNNTKL